MKIKIDIQNKFYISLKGEIEIFFLEKGPQKPKTIRIKLVKII